MVVVPAGFAMFSAESGAGAVGVAGVAPVAGEPTNPTSLPVVASTSDSGLDWTLFAAGLGAAVGLVLLAVVVVVGTRRHSTAAHA